MLPPQTYAPISLSALLPELIVLVGGCLVLLVGQAARESVRRSAPAVVLGTLVLAIVVMLTRAWSAGAPAAGGSGLYYGELASFARSSTLVLGVIVTLVAWLQPRENERGEFWSMLLFSLLGLLLTGAANDLLMLFIALELVSIPTYIMVALSRRNLRALEAGMKYFYLGACAAAMMAYGFSLLYGVSGTALLTNTYDENGVLLAAGTIEAVTSALQEPGTLSSGLAAVGVVLALGGLLFKIAAVPLHFYIADVYQGAASSVAGLLGFVPKFAGFLAIFKIVQVTGHWELADPAVFWLLWIVAAVSMTVGNALALMQTNIKRMLAYSGVAHSGYMLVGVLIGPEAGHGLLGDGTAAVLYYVVVYGIANLGAFAILGLLRVGGQPCETLREIAGLLRRHPGLALLMALAMLTLMGLPPSAGFWGKLSLFGGALASVATGVAPVATVETVVAGEMVVELVVYDRWLVALVVIGVLNSALAAAYYLRVVAAVLLYENEQPAHAVPHEAQHTGALLCGFLLLFFAFCPSWLLEPGRRATAGLRASGAGDFAGRVEPAREGAAQLPDATAEPAAVQVAATEPPPSPGHAAEPGQPRGGTQLNP